MDIKQKMSTLRCDIDALAAGLQSLEYGREGPRSELSEASGYEQAPLKREFYINGHSPESLRRAPVRLWAGFTVLAALRLAHAAKQRDDENNTEIPP